MAESAGETPPGSHGAYARNAAAAWETGGPAGPGTGVPAAAVPTWLTSKPPTAVARTSAAARCAAARGGRRAGNMRHSPVRRLWLPATGYRLPAREAGRKAGCVRGHTGDRA